MTRKIAVLYQGAGNIYSVVRGLRSIGAQPEIIYDAEKVCGFGKLVLPGVGAFGAGMAALNERGLDELIKGHVKAGNLLLGICLGAQLVMDTSEEFGCHGGLGLIPGHVARIRSEVGVKVPHVGWAKIRSTSTWNDTVLADMTDGTHVYFAHSFVCRTASEGNVLARFDYGSQTLVAAVKKDNVTGVQFHPELSGEAGLGILRRFAEY
jgi:glutamine amidotransferase